MDDEGQETKPKSLKERLKEVPSDMDIRMRIMASLGASDYETAMLCGSLLDAMLRHAILTCFAPLSKTHVDNYLPMRITHRYLHSRRR